MEKGLCGQLAPCSEWFQTKCNLEVGRIVLIREDTVPRLQWPLGTLVNVYPGKDGFVHSADVKTHKDVVNRAEQKLHDLEKTTSCDTLPKQVDCSNVDGNFSDITHTDVPA